MGNYYWLSRSRYRSRLTSVKAWLVEESIGGGCEPVFETESMLLLGIRVGRWRFHPGCISDRSPIRHRTIHDCGNSRGGRCERREHIYIKGDRVTTAAATGAGVCVARTKINERR